MDYHRVANSGLEAIAKEFLMVSSRRQLLSRFEI